MISRLEFCLYFVKTVIKSYENLSSNYLIMKKIPTSYKV